MDISTIQASGIVVEGARIPWTASVAPDGEVSWNVDLASGSILGPSLSSTGVFLHSEGRLPAQGAMDLQVTLNDSPPRALAPGPGASPLLVVGEVQADDFHATLHMLENTLDAQVQAADGDRKILELALAMDIETRAALLSRLLLAPSPQVQWQSTRDVTLRLTDDGIQDLDIVLVSVSDGQPGASLEVHGAVDFSGDLDLHLLVRDFSLDPLVPILPFLPTGLAGNTLLELDLGGTAEQVELDGRASVRGLAVPGVIGNLDSDLVLRGGSGGLDLQLRIPEPETTPVGTAPVPEAIAAGRPGKAPASSAPAQQQPSARGLLLNLAGHLPVHLSLNHPDMDMDGPWNLELFLGPGPLRRWEQILDGLDLPELDLSGVLDIGGTPANASLRYSGAVEMPVASTGDRLRLDLHLSQDAGEVDLDVVLSKDMARLLTLKGSASTGLPQVMAGLMAENLPSGSGPTPREPVAEGGLDLEKPETWLRDLNIDLVSLGITADLFKNFAQLPPGLEMRLLGGMHLAGSPLHPDLSGGFQLVDARLGDLEFSPAFVYIVPSEGGFDAQLEMGIGDQGGIDFKGYVPICGDLFGEQSTSIASCQGLHLELGGTGIPLALLKHLDASFQDTSGLLTVNGTVTGSMADPAVDLALGLDGASFSWKGTGLRYDDVSLDATLNGDLIRIDRMEASTRPLAATRSMSSGRFRLNGSVKLKDWMPDVLSLHSRAERFWVADTELFRLAFSGNSDIQGSWPGLEISGDIAIDDARLVADQAVLLHGGTLELDPSFVIHREGTAELGEPAEPEPEGPPWYQDMEVDLDIDLARSAWVEVRMPLDDRFGSIYANLATVVLEAQLDGELNLSFQQSQAQLEGEVEHVRGRAEILGSTFDLEEGTIFFAGDPASPILDVKAIHDAGTYGDIEVSISGGLAELSMDFASEDYPDNTDIVSILVLGKPISDLSGEEGQSQGDLLSMAAGALMGELERSLGGSLFDMVEIDASDSGGIGAIRVGYSIGNNVFLIIALQPEADAEAGENVTEATVEWSINRKWLVEFVTGDAGASSTDLYRSWRF